MGTTRRFESGAVRDNADGKPRFDLFSPIAKLRVGHWMGSKAVHYGERNWEKGIPLSQYLASLERHLMAIQLGERSTPEEDHEAAVIFNAMGFLHTREMIRRGVLPEELDDMPHHKHHRTRVYVAGNYTEGETAPPRKRRYNVAHAIEVAENLVGAGYMVYCPHCATEPFEDYQDYEYWMDVSRSFIENWADVLYFPESEGEPTHGVAREFEWAKKAGVRIVRRAADLPPASPGHVEVRLADDTPRCDLGSYGDGHQDHGGRGWTVLCDQVLERDAAGADLL